MIATHPGAAGGRLWIRIKRDRIRFGTCAEGAEQVDYRANAAAAAVTG